MTTVPFPEFPRVAFLDWDGTFCDSRENIYQINLKMAKYYAERMSVKSLPSYEEWLQASHPGVEACMRSLGVTDNRESINAFFHSLLLAQREAGLRNPLYPGTREFLEFLNSRHIPLIIISRHLHAHLIQDITAHGLAGYFSAIIGEPEHGDLRKDGVMRQICYERSIVRKHTFYLGDTSHDMRLAHQAGVCAIAVSHGYDPWEELTKENPAKIFRSLGEFQQFLSGKFV